MTIQLDPATATESMSNIKSQAEFIKVRTEFNQAWEECWKANMALRKASEKV